VQGRFPTYEHLEEVHNILDEDQLELKCSPAQDGLAPCPAAGDGIISNGMRQETPPLNPPHVSTIQLVPGGGPDSPESGDSGAISDEEEEDVVPPVDSNFLQVPNTSSGTRSATSSSRSSSPIHVETIEELEIAFARDGDVKVVASEELIKTEVYAKFMEKYNRPSDEVEQQAAADNLEESTDRKISMEKQVLGKEREIGNVSPDVEDKYFPIDSFEKDNSSPTESVIAPEPRRSRRKKIPESEEGLERDEKK